jgi:hypothetical protein
MSLAFILALQAAPAHRPPAAPAAPAAVDFDLRTIRPSSFDLAALPGSRACRAGRPGEIIVCGRRGGGDYPMAAMARIFEPRPIVARVGVAGNLSADIHTEARELAPGMVSNRIMFGLRLPF